MGKHIKVMILMVAISFGLNYLYISNRNSNAEIVFSDSIERVDYLLDESRTENLEENLEDILSQEITTQETTIIINNNNKININNATLEELIILPAIGEVLAQRIIDYRTNVCSFENIIDIVNVSGIGENTFENLKDFISID